MYLAIEGIDTAGKSTQIAELKKAFADAVFTKEPGGTAVGADIRTLLLGGALESPKAEFLLFLADRAEHLERVVKPNLDRVLISDRSVVSGVAYALSGGVITESDIITLNRFATDNILPHKIYLLELTPEALAYRLSQKELDGIESRGTDYLLEIQSNLKRACELLGIKLMVFDATLPVDIISEKLISDIRANIT